MIKTVIIAFLLSAVFTVSNSNRTRYLQLLGDYSSELAANIQKDSVEMKDGTIRMVLITYGIDSVCTSEPSISRDYISRQEIMVYNHDTLMFKREHDALHVVKSYENCKEMSILDNYISSFGHVVGYNGNDYFVVSGTGGCSDCSEYYALLNIHGEVLSMSYGTYGKTYANLGVPNDSLNRVLGIEDEMVNQGNYPKIEYSPGY